MGALLDLIGQLLGSNTPTILACVALIAGGAFYYFKVIPSLEELKEYKRKEAEGGLDTSEVSEGLEAIKTLISKLKEENQDAGSVKMLSDVLRATHELERSLNALGRDTQFTNGVVRDLMQSMNDLHTEVSLVRQKLHSISGAIYSTTTGAHDDDRLGDLRSLR
ncbi:membrane protein [Dickeya phage vB_DsoM_JA29]|uniref:Putative membrane protein n=1 Tax=Dickeya phage vB_DsoM_JA29 TaxID=2283031 RepID=A0A384ZX57_9CAUD|nr:membrane protein [Dickeya phage vB_DsoM_JA29]AXG66814.1 putative membrane protein [Dickeya phage vB_DsoM_JA29]